MYSKVFKKELSLRNVYFRSYRFLCEHNLAKNVTILVFEVYCILYLPSTYTSNIDFNFYFHE